MATTTATPIYFSTAQSLLCGLSGCPPDGHARTVNPATGEEVEGHLIPSSRWTNAQANAFEADFARTHAASVPSPLPPEPKRGAHAEPSPVDPERARRHAEAVRYVAEYTGSWGLPLDIRARANWGTKYLRLSDRQIDALLAGRDRDRRRTTDWLAATPRAAEALAWAVENRATNEFAASVADGFERYGRMTDRQLAAILRKLDAPARPLDSSDEFNRRWAGYKNEFAALEREQEAAAFMNDPDMRSSAATVSRGEYRPRVTEDGMYRMAEGTIVKVQKAVNGSGHLYAKRLVAEGAKGSFVYTPGLITRLSPADRMTVEEAAEFGKLYGFCCVCGRTLTDENSIAAGIGPICAGNV